MMSSPVKMINRRTAGNNTWLEYSGGSYDLSPVAERFPFEVLESENAVGRAMFDELIAYSKQKEGDIVILLLGGRGAQAMYAIIRDLAEGNEIDGLLGRLHVFTQDALAPMRMNNGLSFVRDFERLLGDKFFAKIKSFTPMLTETGDIEGALIEYLEKLASLGGIDIFFLGFGPEAQSASHLAYIKPGSGARAGDIAGIIPISPSILEHHINKFKVGGSDISAEDETECRVATHILTLGPAAILGARLIVQSIVDASTAPGKKASFRRMIDTVLSDDKAELEKQLDENPGLWVRLHKNIRSLILPDVLTD